MSRPQPEEALQRQIVDYLRLRRLRFCHVPNGGGRRRVEAAILQGLGVEPGVPDLLIFEIWRTRLGTGHGFGVALELKSASGRATPAQLDWIKALRVRGWLADVVWTFEEARAHIDLIPAALADRSAS